LAGSGDRLLRRQLIEKYPTAGLAILTLNGSSWADLPDGQCRLDGFVKPRDLASGPA
jgi:phosphohistidine phosphatase